MRTRKRQRMYRIERVADAVFILGLLLMVVVCGIITFIIESA